MSEGFYVGPDLGSGLNVGGDPIQPPPGVISAAGSMWSAEQQSSEFYDIYELVTSLEVETGVAGAPLAGDKADPRAAFWRMHGGCTVLRVSWAADRLGRPPALPWPYLSNPLFVLINYSITPECPVVAPDGESLVWRVSGVYSYGLQVAASEASLYVPVGASRMISKSPAELELNGNHFSREPLAFLSRFSPPAVTF